MPGGYRVNKAGAGKCRRVWGVHSPWAQVFAARIIFFNPQVTFARVYDGGLLFQRCGFVSEPVHSARTRITSISERTRRTRSKSPISRAMQNIYIGRVLVKPTFLISLLKYGDVFILNRHARRVWHWI